MTAKSCRLYRLLYRFIYSRVQIRIEKTGQIKIIIEMNTNKCENGNILQRFIRQKSAIALFCRINLCKIFPFSHLFVFISIIIFICPVFSMRICTLLYINLYKSLYNRHDFAVIFYLSQINLFFFIFRIIFL